MVIDSQLVDLLNARLGYWELPSVFKPEMPVEQFVTALAAALLAEDAGRAYQRKIILDALKTIANGTVP